MTDLDAGIDNTGFDVGIDEDVHLPWTTQPSGQGANECSWCGRAIYVPAMPCSIQPVEGLLGRKTMPGLGQRCQYELSTRVPDLVEQFEREILSD